MQSKGQTAAIDQRLMQRMCYLLHVAEHRVADGARERLLVYLLTNATVSDSGRLRCGPAQLVLSSSLGKLLSGWDTYKE